MSDPHAHHAVSIVHQNAQAAHDEDRLAGLREDARRVRAAEHGLAVARGTLGARLYYLHEDGISVTALAHAAGISREAAYKCIDHYRAALPEGGGSR